jgi:hypothetical protein
MRAPDLEHSLACFLRGAGDARAALEAEPVTVAAQLLRAALAVASKDRAGLAAIDAVLEQLAPSEPRLGGRERLHVAAARAWRAGAPARAARLYADAARLWPHDLLAIRLAQSSWFMLGDARALHEVAATAAPHWHPGMPGYDCALALHAFGLEEVGEWAAAETVGRRALDVEPRNAVAVHAVAHALYSAGDPRAGAHWMDRQRGYWRNGGPMASHNGWHLALFRLALGEPARALALYDALVAPALGGSTTDAADAAALLWRLELQGGDVGDRWTPVAEAFALHAMPALWPLVDVHAALAFAAAGRARELDRLRSALVAGNTVAREVALPIARGLEAFAAGEYAESAALLAARWPDAWRLGGSPVQREVVGLTFAAARSRAAGVGRAAAA